MVWPHARVRYKPCGVGGAAWLAKWMRASSRFVLFVVADGMLAWNDLFVVSWRESSAQCAML